MDWSEIISAFITTGGFTAMLTIVERKTGMFLENAKEQAEEWKKIIEERNREVTELKEERDRKDCKIDALLKQVSDQSKDLDTSHSETAVAKLMICDKTGCQKRRPPFGRGLDYDFHAPLPCDGCGQELENTSEPHYLNEGNNS